MNRLNLIAFSIFALAGCVDHNVDRDPIVDSVAENPRETNASKLMFNCNDNVEKCQERNSQSKSAARITSLSEKPSDLYRYSKERADKSRETSSADIVNQFGDGFLFGSPQVNYELATALLREGNVMSALNHLKVSGGVGLPEARYELGLIYGGAYGDEFKNPSFEYAWFATTDQVYRERNRSRRYKNAEKNARGLKGRLSVTELQIAEEKVLEIKSNSSELRRRLIEKSGHKPSQ